MAQSHLDEQHNREFLERLKGRAEDALTNQKSTITAGKPGEIVNELVASNGMTVGRLPPDEQGILRISIGGGDHLPVNADYCRFRGDREQCIALLEKALAALHEVP